MTISEYDDDITLEAVRDEISDLELERQSQLDEGDDTSDLDTELEELRELEKNFTDYDGAFAIADDKRADYVRETCEESIGAQFPPWLVNHIDWHGAADEYLTDNAQFRWRGEYFTLV